MTKRKIGFAAIALACAVGTATSACSSAASKVSSAVSSAASSASAAAKSQLDSFKNGVDGKSDVTLGALAADGDGRTTVPVTVKNSTDKAAGYAVEVNYKNSGGSLLDSVVVTVDNVQPGQSSEATARSTHKLTDPATVSVGTALRH